MVKKSKKSVPLRGKLVKISEKNVHFPRKGTLFLLFWNLKNGKKRVKKVYPYEENSQN